MHEYQPHRTIHRQVFVPVVPGGGLTQWGTAYPHISRKRKEAVISATDPRVLLKDEAIFTSGKEAHEHLFTGELLNLILKEASQDSCTT